MTPRGFAHRSAAIAVAAALVAAAGCGRRGPPVPLQLRQPLPPRDLAVSAPAGRLTLSWKAPRKDLAGRPVEALAAYRVLRTAAPPGANGCAGCPDPGEVVAEVRPAAAGPDGDPATSWADPDARPGWTYRYRVVAVAAPDRPGRPSEPVSVTWTPVPPPGARAIPLDGAAEIAVDAPRVPDGTRLVAFRVYAGGRRLAQEPAGTGAVRVAPLANDQGHTLEVRAVVQTPEGWEVESPGTPVTVTPRDTTPAQPPADLAVLNEPDGLRLLWVPAGTEPYAAIIVLRAEGDGPFVEIARLPGDATGYLDQDSRAGRQYRYAVVSEDRAGNRSPPTRAVGARRR